LDRTLVDQENPVTTTTNKTVDDGYTILSF